MNITSELIGFPFKDERWKNKFGISALIGLIGIVFSPVLYLMYGYGMRVMRQTIRGEEPTLPEWDDFGEIVLDSLRYIAVMFVYFLPYILLITVAVILWIGASFTGPLMGSALDSAELGVGTMVVMFSCFFVLMGISSLLMFPLMILANVGLARAIALDRLGAAFELGEVWKIARKGMGNFLIAFVVWYALNIGASLIASISFFTIVLCFLYPVFIGVVMAYSSVMMGALFGKAYYETMQKMDEPIEAKLAEPAPSLPAEVAAAEESAPKPQTRKTKNENATLIEPPAAKKPRTRKPRSEAEGEEKPAKKPRTRRKKSIDADSEGA